ncbi:MAG: phage portal protein [Planctomycetota bacterium]
MAYELSGFEDIALDDGRLRSLIARHERCAVPYLSRLWMYFRNPLHAPDTAGGSAGPPAQAVGLPDRLRTPAHGTNAPREVVIENDIAWRVQTLIDFMFPEPPAIVSAARDADTRMTIDTILADVMAANGGATLWHNAAMLGSIYGHVDFLVHAHAGTTCASTRDAAIDAVRIDLVDALRGIPILCPTDYRRLDGYILRYERETSHHRTHADATSRVLNEDGTPSRVTVTEIYSATHAQVYEDEVLVRDVRHGLGRVPVVHVQNMNQPLRYAGLSDVEPLIPLQDELNTRLSDRANRVTLQSFRMWLGKGIEQFVDRPVGPGQMWMTDNPEASIESFGGDAGCPSELAHILDVREAMDKASGVAPAAAGHIQSRVGNLTSENAVRISLLGTIAKVNRKRVTYEQGIRNLCAMVLHVLDAHGILRTQESDRAVNVIWSDALPPDESRRIEDALKKAELGVPTATLRSELGYPDRPDDRNDAA